MELCNRSEVKKLLEKYSLSPKKAFGQNFLVNPSIPLMIAENSYKLALEAKRDVPMGVIEVGPGIGALTSRLAEYYDKVVAVEIDRGLIPLLDETLSEYSNVEIVENDIMKLDIPEFIQEKFGDILEAGGTVSVCANLPYYITSPVIMKFIESYSSSEALPYAAITVMIQLEVADRLSSQAGNDSYGSVTASIALHADVRKLMTVSAGNFHPAPKVASAVIGIIPHGGIREIYPNIVSEELSYEDLSSETHKLINLAFAQRRKTLVNALSGAYPKEKILSALEACSLRVDIRGEKLSPEDFCRLADMLHSQN